MILTRHFCRNEIIKVWKISRHCIRSAFCILFNNNFNLKTDAGRKDKNILLLLRSSACFQQHFHDWFSVLRYAIQIWWNVNKYYHYITSTESVICQIDGNCSPSKSLSMLPFHIGLERFKTDLLQFNIKFF